jgi:uncharacterized repeat protein (TIGR01451 family)
MTQDGWDALDDNATVYRTLTVSTLTDPDDPTSVQKSEVFAASTKAELEAGLYGSLAIQEVGGRVVGPAGTYNLGTRVHNLDITKCGDADDPGGDLWTNEDIEWIDNSPVCDQPTPTGTLTQTDPQNHSISIVAGGAQSIRVKLGNNGWVSYAVPGSLRISKEVQHAAGLTPDPDEPFTFRVTLAGATAEDDLTDILASAALVEPLPAGVTPSGRTLTWAIPDLVPGATASVSYQVRVSDAAAGATLRNVVTGSGAPPPDPCPDRRDVEHPVASWVLGKSSDPPDGLVQPGATVTYTLTATNPGTVPVDGVTAVDDLSQVLTHARLTEPLAAGPSLSETTLTWQVPTIAPGGTQRVSYSVSVAADADGTGLVNVATPGDPTGGCAGCTTDHDTPPQPPQPPATPTPTPPGTTPPAGAHLPQTGGDGYPQLVGTALLRVVAGLGSTAVRRLRRRSPGRHTAG